MTDVELVHSALDGSQGSTFGEARLTDQQRLAIVLQGAALLSHLDRVGLRLVDGWKTARVTSEGKLVVGKVAEGSSGSLPQVALRELLQRVFGAKDERIPGRGEARRIARVLADRWRHTLIPFSIDRAVADILDEATFLWKPRFAPALVALASASRRDGQESLWLAGPGAARRRLLAGVKNLDQLLERLRSPQARDLWEGWSPQIDATSLAENRHWRRAIAAWRRAPPTEPEVVELYARSLFALGRYSRALKVVKPLTTVDAGILKAWCQRHLGEIDAALATIRELADSDLSADQIVDLAEVALRALGPRGLREAIDGWLRRLETMTEGRTGLRAAMTGAGAAWELDDFEAMDRFLKRAEKARDEPELAGMWHRMRGLRALAASDGLAAVEHITKALRLDRRRLLRSEAGRLWNDLAIGRAYADDLAGAERACRHALRLLSDVEGPSSTTLASANLTEILVRRGRAADVESTLVISTAESRRSGDWRSLIHDLELRVRFELAQGRASAALERCNEAFRLMERWEFDERRQALEVLAARSYGWLGSPSAAAASLEAIAPMALGELDAEERPAVWALAGKWREAMDEAARTPWEEIWSSLAAGRPPSPRAWSALSSLEPFRGARLAFDCELVLAGSVPPSKVREAIFTLRRCGAEALAERLESRSLSPWKAVGTYLESSSPGPDEMARLLEAAGYSEVRVSWQKYGDVTVLVEGPGGTERLSKELREGGELRLSAPWIDTVLETLFALLVRDFRPPSPGLRQRRSLQSRRGDIIGESPALLEALERLEKLAQGELPILILGESGTGKELFARHVHRISRRRSKAFRPVNCAALPATLIEPDLFGHVKGSFTGADRDREGIFESARGGTVFLDEIGDLPPSAQGQLLRVLQEGEIRRVGESFARKVDVRIVAATHRDLEHMVDEKTFRQDLFYRLKVATVRLPALRQRGGDILRLADFFLSRIETEGVTLRFSESVRQSLAAYAWPGNIRELRNVIEVGAALSEDGEIRDEHVDLPGSSAAPRGDYHQMVDDYRRKLISEALDETSGNRSAAARRLGLTRQALSYLVKRLALD